ncbi:MAG: type II toxin-antitoxin system RelE/ParE family toxin [Methanomassiliicoccaceae archaeon]|nr:type II toxin-antitoxin system RelE/ParE family toxin [Methanomassiliicoccaceae archaeon]
MTYEVIYAEDARRSLKKMDAAMSGAILSWIEKNLVGTDNPRRSGKALAGDLAGMWRYRVGDFRIFAKIEDKRLVILILEIRNRRNAYR